MNQSSPDVAGRSAANRSSGGGDDGHHTLEHVVDGIADLGDKQDKVSVSDMQDEIGQRSFGPFLFVPAIIEISPVGGIPGVPTILAVIVSLFALQIMFGRKSFWLPKFLANASVNGDKLNKGMEKMRKPVRFVDKLVRHRLRWATKAPYTHVAAALTVAAAASVPPLEVLPFASSIPFSAIALIGLGFAGRDGLLVLIGMGGAVAALGTVAYVLIN